MQAAVEEAGIVEKISAATEEQSHEIKEVTSVVQQISAIVQSNSSKAEESAAVSEELSEQANYLEKAISEFKMRNDV